MSGRRLLVFSDGTYRRDGDGAVVAEQAFGAFLGALVPGVDRLVVAGRCAPATPSSPATRSSSAGGHRLPRQVDFRAMAPHDLGRPASVLSGAAASLTVLWRALDAVDAVWVLGPHPHALALALMARLRRRQLVLGVRQDFPAYVRRRRPGRRGLHLIADGLERGWRRLARRHPVIAVGRALARTYADAPAVLELHVSLLSAADVAAGAAARRRYDGPLELLSVGRLDPEKNPLLLVDVLERLRARDPRWRLSVCGEGQLAGALATELGRRGLTEHARLHGYEPMGERLLARYRDAHAFLHVSLTEGEPQVLWEAFGSGTPVVATAVGGVPDAAAGAGLLIAPADAEAAASALTRAVTDAGLRERLISAGLTRAARHTREHEAGRVLAFVFGEAGDA